MNWRWIVSVLIGFAFIEVTAGCAAYGSSTWNLGHTEVLTGWDAVRLVCLVFVPLMLLGLGVFGALLIAALQWASGGRR